MQRYYCFQFSGFQLSVFRTPEESKKGRKDKERTTHSFYGPILNPNPYPALISDRSAVLTLMGVDMQQTKMPPAETVHPILKGSPNKNSKTAAATTKVGVWSGFGKSEKSSAAEKKHLTWDEHAIEEHDLLRGTRMKVRLSLLLHLRVSLIFISFVKVIFRSFAKLDLFTFIYCQLASKFPVPYLIQNTYFVTQ